MNALHDDAMRLILDHCTDADVRRLALVSREFRSIATTHAYFALSCFADISTNDDDLARARSAVERVNHALALELPLSVSIYIRSEQTDGSIQVILRDHLYPRVAKASRLIKILSFNLQASELPSFETIFTQPFPILRYLSFWAPSEDAVFTIPPDLFRGCAPKLRRVHLLDAAPGNAPVSAFSQVNVVSLLYFGIVPTFDASHHFPAASHVKFTTFSPSGLDLRGYASRSQKLHLNYESLTMSPRIQGLLDISHVQTISYSAGPTAFPTEHDECFWIGLPTSGRVTVCVAAAASGSTFVVSVHCAGIQRNVSFSEDKVDPLRDLIEPLVARVVDLKLEVGFVSEWVGILTELAWPAMERLHLNISHSSSRSRWREFMDDTDDDWDSCERFNALRTVLLTAQYDPDDVEDISLTIAHTDSLAYLLGQYERDKDTRASLQVFGLLGDDHDPENSMFSSVSFDNIENVWRASPLDLSPSSWPYN